MRGASTEQNQIGKTLMVVGMFLAAVGAPVLPVVLLWARADRTPLLVTVGTLAMGLGGALIAVGAQVLGRDADREARERKEDALFKEYSALQRERDELRKTLFDRVRKPSGPSE